jgi:hypothetical protein
VELSNQFGVAQPLQDQYAIASSWDSRVILAKQSRSTCSNRTKSLDIVAVYLSDQSADGTCVIYKISNLQLGRQQQQQQQQPSSRAPAAAAATAARPAQQSKLVSITSATATAVQCSVQLRRVTGLSFLAGKQRLAVVADGKVLLLQVDTSVAVALCRIAGAHAVAADADGALFVSSTTLRNIQKIPSISSAAWQQMQRGIASASGVQPQLFAGSSTQVCGAAEGSASNALLACPTGLATFHKTLFVCDQGVAATTAAAWSTIAALAAISVAQVAAGCCWYHTLLLCSTSAA